MTQDVYHKKMGPKDRFLSYFNLFMLYRFVTYTGVTDSESSAASRPFLE